MTSLSVQPDYIFRPTGLIKTNNKRRKKIIISLHIRDLEQAIAEHIERRFGLEFTHEKPSVKIAINSDATLSQNEEEEACVNLFECKSFDIEVRNIEIDDDL